MPWWSWILLGLLLLGLELTSGSLFLLFPAVAALAIGLLAWFDIGAAWLEWLLFSVLSVGTLLLFRHPLKARLQPSGDRHDLDDLVGGIALVTGQLAPGQVGKAEMRGTVWNVKNAGVVPLEAGQRCRVTGTTGLELELVAEDPEP
jgi:membrane protein implicated in regulation of membrane protease activity